MFKPDLPIESCAEEKKYGLDRCKFARSLGDAILRYNGKESFVIGLSGEWGSGKTSIINMALEHITSKDWSDEGKPIIVKFNPWNFSNQNQLIKQFFDELSAKLSEDSKVVEKLKSYVNKLVPPVLMVSSITSPNYTQALLNSAKWIDEHPLEGLESLKSELDELISKKGCKIIIIIEDIDRLNNLEIRQIFQLVKLLANFSNTNYILEFDKNIIIKALEKDMHNYYSSQYLEKIVQVIFDVPQISELEIELILNTEIGELIKDYSDRLDKDRWTFYYQEGLKYIFKDIRAIKRYINTLKLSFGLLKDEVDLADLFAITAIQVLLPNVYNTIKNNKEIFVCRLEDINRSYKTDQDIHKYDEFFNKITNENSAKIQEKELKNLLKCLFPILTKIYDEKSSHSHDYDEKSHILPRDDTISICVPEAFDTYFRLSVPEWTISREEFYEILSVANDFDAFGKKLVHLNKNGKIIKFLDYFDVYTRRDNVISIPEENIEPIVAALIDKGDSFPPNDLNSEENKTVFLIYRIFENLIYRIKNRNIKCNILKNAIYKAENSIYTIIYVLQNVEEEDYILLNEMQIQRVEKLKDFACQKVEELYKDGKLIDHRNSFSILFWLNIWGYEKKVNKIINDIFKDKERIIKFIKTFFHPNKALKYELCGENGIIDSIIDLNLLKDSLEEIYNSPDFKNLDEEEKFAVSILFHKLRYELRQ